MTLNFWQLLLLLFVIFIFTMLGFCFGFVRSPIILECLKLKQQQSALEQENEGNE